MYNGFVALFTRAWIEIAWITPTTVYYNVALFTRAWIEIFLIFEYLSIYVVALFTRAWIEIKIGKVSKILSHGRPLHEGVD